MFAQSDSSGVIVRWERRVSMSRLNQICIHTLLLVIFSWIVVPCCPGSLESGGTQAAMISSASAEYDPEITTVIDKTIPELVKTKPYSVVDLIKVAYGDIDSPITDEKILDVQVIPLGRAKGFAYFDGRTTWRLKYGLTYPEDFDNNCEENCWKVIGGMTEEEKLTEFDPLGEGGAALGKSGTGEIGVKVFYKNHLGGVSIETFRARVVLKKLIIEVDWMEGSTRETIVRGERREIDFKPNITQEFIDAFGQAGIEVDVRDTPKKGNLHNIIPKDTRFDSDLLLNRANLADLLPDKYKGWRSETKVFNQGLSYIAKVMMANGYMDFDASRSDVIYVVGAQRWKHLPGNEVGQTRGATAIFQHGRRKYSIVFIFNLATAESVAAVNKIQDQKVPWELANLHTVLHECSAHCFPIRWKNKYTELCDDPYWQAWRYMFVGHKKRNEFHEYGRIYRTCVTRSETLMDAAYHTYLHEPRLGDFSNCISNCVDNKCRDIIRDYVVEDDPKEYGRTPKPSQKVASKKSPLALSLE